MFDWDRAFINTSVNEKVFILNKTIFVWIYFLILFYTKTMFIRAIATVKTTKSCITSGDWKFYKKTYVM